MNTSVLNEGPFIVTLDGRQQTFADRRSFKTHIRAIESELADRNIDVARVRCRLGWALIEYKKAVGHGNFKDVYREMRINERRGQEVCKFARLCANPVTGEMIDERYYRYAKLALAEAAEQNRKLHLDADGNPSVTPVMNAAGVGQGSHYRGKVAKSAVNRAFQDGDESPAPQAFGGRGRGSVLEACLVHAPAGRRASSSDAGCVGAEQPDLPWHLAESARRLADAAAGLEARLAAGDADRGFARRVQERIDAILADLERADGEEAA